MAPAGEPHVGRVDRTFDGVTASVAEARDSIRPLLEAAPPRTQDDAALVISELITNAIEASPGRPYRLVLERTASAVAIEVHSDAQWEGEPPTDAPLPGIDVVRGRGLHIVRALCGEPEIVIAPHGGVVVRARLPL